MRILARRFFAPRGDRSAAHAVSAALSEQTAGFLINVALVLASASTATAGINVWTRLGLEGGQITTLAIDPATPTTLYAVKAAFNVGSRVCKSTDAGATWGATELTRPDIRALAIDPVTPSTLYAGTDGGVFSIEQVSPCVGDCTPTPTPTPTPTGGLPTPTPTGSPRVAVVGTGTAASCTEAALAAALAGGGYVTFNCGGPATIIAGRNDITIDTAIDGGGLITISGLELAGGAGVFTVIPGVNFSVKGVTIANSLNYSGGGAIHNSGSLFVSDSTFNGNASRMCEICSEGGGAIFNEGVLTVTNSTFSGNFSNASGGGILNQGGLAIVMDSTFAGNQYDGITNLGGELTVINSTFSGQTGAGIVNDGGLAMVVNSTCVGNGYSIFNGQNAELTVINSTFAGNADGGILNYGSALLRNTVLANDGRNCLTAPSGTMEASRRLPPRQGRYGSFGTITDGGHNLDDGGSCAFDSEKGSLSNTDPQLDPAGLQSHGGRTQTIALCTAVGVPMGCTAASPATDAGDPAVCATAPVSSRDQRGFARPGAGHANCSSGAYEAEVTPVACDGDCDASGAVTVNELVVLVRVALGHAGPTTCLRGIASGASVDIALLIAAVNNALKGCPARDLFVAATGNLNGDGSIANPYRRITDAVAQARAKRASGAVGPEQEIAIQVAPGTYVGSFDAAALQNHPEYEVLPIILNVPRLTLLGSTVLTRDERGLPTATSPGSESIVAPDTPLLPNQYLILVTRSADGGVGDGVTVDGFVFDGKDSEFLPHGADVFIDRVSEFRFTNNLVEHSAFGVMTRLASGTIEGNLLADNVELGSVVSGGSRAHPATVLIRANRATRNAAHGIGCTPGGWIGLVTDPGGNSITLLEPLQTTFDRNSPADVENVPATLNVTLDGNDASNNGRPNSGGGIGIRLAGIWPDFTYTTTDPSQPVTSSLVANVIGNSCDSNGAYGVAIEAGDTQRSAPRRFIQSLAANFEGNVFIGNDRAPALFTFTYWLVSTGKVPHSSKKFAEASTFAVTDADGEFVTFDYDNPATDLVSGTVLNNTLTLNAVEVPRGNSITPP